MTETMTPDIIALCAALDAGDNSVLPILADALEEAGDARADGIRLCVDRQPYRVFARSGRGMEVIALWQWVEYSRHDEFRAGSSVPAAAFKNLKDGKSMNAQVTRKRVSKRLGYPTRSAAYLALATALMESTND